MPAEVIFFQKQRSPHHLDKFTDLYGSSGYDFPSIKTVSKPFVPLYDVKYNVDYDIPGTRSTTIQYLEEEEDYAKAEPTQKQLFETAATAYDSPKPVFYRRKLYEPPSYLLGGGSGGVGYSSPYLTKSKSARSGDSGYFLPPVSRSGTPSFNSTAPPSYVHLGSMRPRTQLDESIDKFLNSTTYEYPPYNEMSKASKLGAGNLGTGSTALSYGYYPWSHYYPFTSSGLSLPSSSTYLSSPYTYPPSYIPSATSNYLRSRSYLSDDEYDPLIRAVPKKSRYSEDLDTTLNCELSSYASKYYGATNFNTDYLVGKPGGATPYLARSISSINKNSPSLPFLTTSLNSGYNLRLGADTPSYYPVVSKHSNYMVYYPYSRYIDSYYPLSSYKRGLKSYYDMSPKED